MCNGKMSQLGLKVVEVGFLRTNEKIFFLICVLRRTVG